jgi:hypothetical protein
MYSSSVKTPSQIHPTCINVDGGWPELYDPFLGTWRRVGTGEDCRGFGKVYCTWLVAPAEGLIVSTDAGVEVSLGPRRGCLLDPSVNGRLES